MKRKIALLIIVAILLVSNLVGCKPKDNQTTSSNGQKIENTNSDNGDINLELDGKNGETTTTGTANATGFQTSSGLIQNLDMKGKTVRIACNWYTPNFAKTQMGKIQIKRIEDIQKKFNCKIEIKQYADVNSDVLTQKMAAAADLGGDILGVRGNVPMWLKYNTIVPLNGLGLDFNNKNYDTAYNASFTFNSKQYVVKPIDQAFDDIQYYNAMFFNKRLLKEAGIDPNQIYEDYKSNQWTWDKYEEYCKKITKKDANGNYTVWGGITATNGDDDNNLWVRMIETYGTNPVKITTNGTLELNIKNNTVARDALYRFEKMVKNGAVYCGSDNKFRFSSGNVGFEAQVLQRLQNQDGQGYQKVDYGIIPMPTKSPGDKYIATKSYWEGYGISSLAIAKDDANRTLAKEYATIIDALCQPLLTQAQEKTLLPLQIEAVAKDQESIDFLKNIKDIGKVTRNYEVATVFDIYFRRNVLVPQLMNTPMSSLIDANIDKYNNDVIAAQKIS